MKNKLFLLFFAGLVLASVPLLLIPLAPTPSQAQSVPPVNIPLATISSTNLPDGRVVVTISYPSDTNHNYVVEYRESLLPDTPDWKQLPAAPHNRGVISVTNTATQRLYRIRMVDQPQKGIFALLANDTGLSVHDSITMDPTIDGEVAETGTPADLEGRLDGTDGDFTTLIPNIPSRQNFAISPQQLDNLAGGNLAEGRHNLQLQKYDEVRNILWKATVDFLLDTVPPDTFITSQPPEPGSTSPAVFTFTGADDLTPTNRLRFAYRHFSLVAPAPATTNWSSCTNPVTLTPLLTGAQIFEVRAIDEAGNVDPTPASYAWAIDTTPPPISLALDPAFDSSPLGDLTTAFNNVSLVGLTEPNLAVTLNGNLAATTAESSGAFVFNNISLVPGSNPFTASTFDPAGNSASTSITITNVATCPFANLDGWTVTTSDFGLPNLPITSPVRGAVTATGCQALMTEGDSFLVTVKS